MTEIVQYVDHFGIHMKYDVKLHLAVAEECQNAQMTQEARTAVLNQHNHLRSQLAFGRAKTKGGGFAPSGKNIYKLGWDCQLEYHAQDWANKCVFQHSPSSHRHGAGENIYEFWNTGSIPSTEQLALDAGKAWWDELIKYGMSSPNNLLTMEVFNKGVGHFTQMAWGATTKIGCGVAKNCGGGAGWNNVLIVCQYMQAGNYIGEPIYQLGNPCKAETDCTTFKNSSCSITEGLCIERNFSDITTVAKDPIETLQP